MRFSEASLALIIEMNLTRQIARRLYSTRTVGFCVIGDEILNGKTQDTNTRHLANLCFSLGVSLTKVETVPDDSSTIQQSIRSLSHHHDLVMTSGGIGPTHDDITYQSISHAFNNSPLEYHQETLRRMRKIMAQRGVSEDRLPDPRGTDQQRATAKMALLPSHSTVSYPREDWWVPVVCVNGNVHIMPGIPRLFELLVDTYLPGLLANQPAEAFVRTLISTRLAEPSVSAILETLQDKYSSSGIKIGSYPNWVPQGTSSLVLSVIGRDPERVRSCGKELCELVNGTVLFA